MRQVMERGGGHSREEREVSSYADRETREGAGSDPRLGLLPTRILRPPRILAARPTSGRFIRLSDEIVHLPM